MSSYPTRSHKLYNGSDATPVFDYTEEEWTDWAGTELANAADAGDSTTSTWVVRDENGLEPNSLNNAGPFLSAHNVVITTVGSNTLFRGRIDYKDQQRGRQKVGRATEHTVNLSDANSHLNGIIVHNWVRPEETDAARVQALVAAYLSGSPRATTNLNGSNLVITGSNTITVPAKTYTGVTPSEILAELVELSDKEMFVTVDNELAYFGHDYTGYASTLRISDDPADLNANTCVPIEPSNSENSRDQITALRTYWGNNTSSEQNTFQRVDSTRAAVTDYWEDVNFDSVSTTWAEASQRATSVFQPRKLDQTTYTVTIGAPGTDKGQPMSGDDIYKVKAGQLINFKSLAARGGRNAAGAWIGDTFLTRRIREVRWTFTGVPDQYWCTLTLDRPRLNARGAPFHSPQAPDTGTPGTPPTAPTTDLQWTFADLGGTDAANLYDDNTSTYTWIQGGWLASEEMWWGGSGARLNPSFPVTAGTTYTFLADLKQNATNAAVWMRVEWYNAGGILLQTDYLAGPGVTLNSYTTYSKVITAPATATKIFMRAGAFRGKKGTADNIYIKHGGSGGTAGTESTSPVTTVGGTGQGQYTDSGQYVPVGSVLEHDYITDGGPYHDADQIAIDDVGDYYVGSDVEAALQEIGAELGGTGANFLTKTGGEGHTVVTASDAGSAYELDLASGNVFDITLTEDCTISATGFTTGQWCEGSVIVHQDSTGGWDLSFDAAIEEPSGGLSLPTTADTTSGFGFGSLDGGTTIYVWSNGGGSSGASALDDLSDVTTTGEVSGVGLFFNGTNWAPAYAPAPLLLEDGTVAILEDGSAAMSEPDFV